MPALVSRRSCWLALSCAILCLASCKGGPDDLRAGQAPIRLAPVEGSEQLLRAIPAEPRTLHIPGDRGDGLEAAKATTATKVIVGDEARMALISHPTDALVLEVDIDRPSLFRFGLTNLGEGSGLRPNLQIVPAGPAPPPVVEVEQVDLLSDSWSDYQVRLPAVGAARILLRLEGAGDDSAIAWSGLSLERDSEKGSYPNLLFIVADTLRADHLSLYGYPRRTSPRLDAWAEQRAVVFETTVAAAPWTLPSHTSMFTGLDALTHGVNYDVGGISGRGVLGVESEVQTLAEQLHAKGYQTAANTGGVYLDPKYGLSWGFESYRSWQDRSQDRKELKKGVDRALRWIESRGNTPFFYFLHTYEVHDPYRIRPAAREFVDPDKLVKGMRVAMGANLPSEENSFQQSHYLLKRVFGDEEPLPESETDLAIGLYDGEIRKLDRELNRLFEGLSALGVLDDTLVVVTSDHGDAFGEAPGRFGHVDLYDSVLKVPLIMHFPDGRWAGTRVPEQVRSIDIVPTILATLQIPPANPVDGASLLNLLEDDQYEHPLDAFSYSASFNRGLALRHGNHSKLIYNNSVWPRINGEIEFYDLVNDPLELSTLPSSEQIEPLLSRLLAVAERRTGLQILLQNPGPRALRGELNARGGLRLGVKSFDLQCDCLSPKGRGIAFTIPPETSYTLDLEVVRETRLDFEISFQGSPAHRLADQIDLEQLTDTKGFYFSNGWQSSIEESRGVGIAFRWLGTPHFHDASPAQEDEALRDQLEALGYISDSS